MERLHFMLIFRFGCRRPSLSTAKQMTMTVIHIQMSRTCIARTLSIANVRIGECPDELLYSFPDNTYCTHRCVYTVEFWWQLGLVKFLIESRGFFSDHPSKILYYIKCYWNKLHCFFLLSKYLYTLRFTLCSCIYSTLIFQYSVWELLVF